MIQKKYLNSNIITINRKAEFLYSEKFRSSVGDSNAQVNGLIVNYLAGLEPSTYRSIVNNNKTKIAQDINRYGTDYDICDHWADKMEEAREKWSFLSR